MPFEHSARRAHGHIERGLAVTDTLQCCHCGTHFEVIKGSGRRRGFCLKCMEVTCGAAQCVPCIPIEARLDHLEGKKTPYDDAIRDIGGLR